MNQFEHLIKPDDFHWQQLCKLLEQQTPPPSAEFIEALQRLALGSNYAISQCVKYPELIQPLADYLQFELEPSVLETALQGLSDIALIKQQLRLFRHRKLIQIIYLDICRQQPVEQTLLQLSELADLLIQQALQVAEQNLAAKHGQPLQANGEPMQLNIIAMGKLGGRELNFSSDVDLICCYSEEGTLSGFGKLSHTQFFTHVVKLFKQLLHEVTADGFVYRVDLRLRPWGDSGPIVLSHTAFEHYYQLHGREWEQYAMVKARVITGSATDKKHLKSIIRPFVYRRYHDYRVFEGLALLKHKIDQQTKNKAHRRNIKMGRGGIREVEFFVQAFQVLKGGRSNQLQTPSLFKVIEILQQQEITDRPTLNSMRASYCFLRMLENRIQMMNDQQTHEIPTRQNHLDRISLLLGYDDWPALDQQLQQHLEQVNRVFSELFSTHEEQYDKPALHMDELADEQHLASIRQYGFVEPQVIHQRLLEFYHSKALLYMSEKAKKRFHIFFPELLKQISQHAEQLELLNKMLALLSSIAGRSVYFELLYQNIPLLMKLVHLFDSSHWIAEQVTRHPLLLESLLYPGRVDQRFNKVHLRQELNTQLNNVIDDIELELDILRQFKRAQTIVIATAEIAQEISTAQVSEYLSELAEIILQAVYQLAFNEVSTQYGIPQCRVDDQLITPVLGIIAYGKLGGCELHYQSDLDIIFLHNSSGSEQITNGQKSIDNAVFFSRLAQKIISKVSMLTAAGKLYEIDTRLRPNGASGMLVSSLSAYQSYQLEKAWVWEHQAIIRARYIAGDPIIQQQFAAIHQQVLLQPRDPQALQSEITQMRAKMYQASNPVEGDSINIKHSKHCMLDIEFLVQYLVLQHANKFASLIETTDNVGLITELHRLHLIDDHALALRESYLTLHRWLHARVLQNQSAEIASALVRQDMDLVQACWNKTFNT